MKSQVLRRGFNVLKSLAISFILTLILLILISVLLAFTPLKESTIPLLNTIVVIVSIAIGSIYMALNAKEKGWLNGGLIGILYFIILLLINLLFIKPFIFDIYTISKLFISLIAGAIGGMIGVNLK